MYVSQLIFQILYRYSLGQLLLPRPKSLGWVLSLARCHQPAWRQAHITGWSVLHIQQAWKDHHGNKWYSPAATRAIPKQNSTLTLGCKVVLVALGEIESLFCLGEKIIHSNHLTQTEIYVLRTSDILYTFMHAIFISDNLPFYKSCYWTEVLRYKR